MPVTALDIHPQDTQETARRLLQTIDDLARQTRPQGHAAGEVSLDSSLERDLGLDSLGRTELLLRIERAFDIRLPEQTLMAETPRDLLRAVLAACGGAESAAVPELRYQGPGAAQAAPDGAATLIEALDWHVQKHPERTQILLYQDAAPAEEISYASLYHHARLVAAGLLDRDLQPGQTVAIMLPTGREYFFSFFGILLAGGIPVPIYPPVRPSQIEEHLRRHTRILGNARATILITIPEAKVVAHLLKAQVKELRHVATAAELGTGQGREAPARIGVPRLRSQDLAFLQYTSGSTGDPKGVMLTHANLLANLRAMGQRVQVRSTDVFVSWLPLYHDMGLIGAWLGSLYYAFPLVVMSPLTFLTKPASWLWAVHRYRGSVSAAPNFAFQLCLRNIAEDSIEGLDLSSLRYVCNGAEPIGAETMQRFQERFSRYGLRPEALAPVYGLAESSVGLALPRPGRGVMIDRIQRDAFMQSGEAVPAAENDPAAMQVVACGQPLSGHQIRIVDERGRELPERREGVVEFKGPSCTSGYFQNPEATRKLFDGGWLNSGDRGYIAGGDVYLTGRIKDVIIRGGRNIYPYELENAVGSLGKIRKGCVAVFAGTDPRSGSERLVVVAETRETAPEILKSLRQDIRQLTVDLLGTPPDDVVLAPPHTVLKTSSGKIRRTAVRDLYQRQALGQGNRAVWWQLARLAGASVLPQLRRMLRHGGDVLYAGYAWTVLAAMAPLTWLLVAVLPRYDWRWKTARTGMRLLQRLTGMRLSVQGLENLPDSAPCVLVANHASYADCLFLIAALPRNIAYVAKRELADHFLLRVPLERLDTVFVERFDLHQSAKEAQRITQILRGGRSLVFFPEGTFDRMPGLLPFRMGAFVTAARAGLPVVPVTIRGTRSILRSESWFPRRGKVWITLEKPIRPQGRDWHTAVTLRDAARAAILRHCGEPDLAEEDVFTARRSEAGR